MTSITFTFTCSDDDGAFFEDAHVQNQNTDIVDFMHKTGDACADLVSRLCGVEILTVKSSIDFEVPCE